MKHFTNPAIAILLFCSLFLLSACATWKPKAVDRLNLDAPPKMYSQSTDTTQMRLSWRALFTDKYLAKLIDTALVRNYDRKIAFTNIAMSMSEVQRSSAPLVPQVQGIATTGAERFGDYTMNGVGNYDLNRSENITNKQRVPTPFMPDMYVGAT